MLGGSGAKETEDVAVGILTFASQAKGVVEANIVTQPNNIGSSLDFWRKWNDFIGRSGIKPDQPLVHPRGEGGC